MRRIVRVVALANLLLAACATPPEYRPSVVIVTNNASLSPDMPTYRSLAAGLALKGTDPRSITWTRFDAERDHDLLGRQSADAVALNPDLIITGDTTATIAVFAEQQAKDTHIPVVFWSLDPIAAGVVEAYGRSGTDFVGSADAADTQQRELELLAAVVPGLSKVGVLYNPSYAPAAGTLRELQDAGRTMGLMVTPYETLTTQDFEASVTAMARDGMQAMVVGPHSLFSINGRRIGELAQVHRLPTVSLVGTVLQGGGIAAFGPDFGRIWRDQGGMVDAILRGGAPRDMPINRPPAALSLNLKAARKLGLTIPDTVLAQAQVVID